MIANLNLSNAIIASITFLSVANARPQEGPLHKRYTPAPSLSISGSIKPTHTYNPASDKPAPTHSVSHISDKPVPHPSIIIDTKPLPSPTSYDDGQ